MLISLDTETTGLDLHHDCKPFFVTTCDSDGNITFWEWDVDPLTRQPIVPPKELTEIHTLLKDCLSKGTELVLQNPKYDVAALSSLDKTFGENWSWENTRDTLRAGHLLASNQPKDLTSMAIQYLNVDISKCEQLLHEACAESRKFVKKHFPDWKIAKEKMEGAPSTKGKVWKADYWLPRAVAKKMKYPKDHPWWTVLSTYANTDSAITVELYKVMIEEVRRRKLEPIYMETMKTTRVAFLMERNGLTLSEDRIEQMKRQFTEEREQSEVMCKAIASDYGYELEIPKSGNNNSLKKFVFDVLELPAVNYSEQTGEPSLDSKVTLPHFLAVLPRNRKPYHFIKHLSTIRGRSTALSYLESYERFWVNTEKAHWKRIHPSLNPTGTNTLRWSSSNPNEQNISKREGLNLRQGFGPRPGRVWYSFDAQNIELRLPAYECKELEMIALFERPNEAPYFGSNHLLVSHILHPKEFEACVNEKGEIDGRLFKKKYASTLYQWVKNGNFAVQYGAVEESGTADRAYHVPGGQARIQARFKNIAMLNERMIDHANVFGYVETIPDIEIDPTRGYPLLCTRSTWGKIVPTVPLNYHIQGSAMWWMMRAMNRCQNQIDLWNIGIPQRKITTEGIYIAIQVHDEMVFDFPANWSTVDGKRVDNNLPKLRTIKRLMEKSGDCINIPTPVSCECHEVSWDVGVTVVL